MSYIDDPTPRGWLRFLIIVLMFLGPLVGLGRMYGEFADTEQLYPQLVGLAQWESYKSAAWATFALQAGLSIVAGYRLDNVYRPSAPRFVIAVLWLGGVGLTILFHVLAGTLLDIDYFSGADGAQVIGSLAGGAFWAIVWTIYLLRSKQVKKLYYSQVGDETSPMDNSRAFLSLEAWPRERRRAVFFAIAWSVLILVFALLFDDEYDGLFSGDYGRDWSKVLSWAIIPPALVLMGIWAYRRFVGSEDQART